MTKKNDTTKTTETIKGADVGTVPAGVVAEANKGPEVVTTAASVNKSAIATAIFDECYKMNPVPQRKTILERVKNEAGLTDAGAATYLQNYKRKHGLSKAPATATAGEAPAADEQQDGDAAE